MDNSVIKRIRNRESNSFHAHKFCNDNHVNEDMLHRLQLEKELVGHSGCVNCLEWNESGSILVSGSDDTNIILWDPSTRTPIKTYASTHHGNIFSVKFLPKTNNHFIATGAADNHVFVHDIERGEKIHGHRCDGRVKRLVVTPDHPNIIWSVSEDGAIRQFDMRQEPFAITRVLLDLSAMCGPSAEGKCLAINPTQTDYLALGANDQYVRLYDRRMIKPKFSKKKRRHDYDGCATYFTPAHLHHKRPELKRRGKYLCTTYVAFNPKGDELLANLGGEQLYLFNIFSSDQSVYDPITETLTQVTKQDQSSEIPSCSAIGSNGISLTHSAKHKTQSQETTPLLPAVEKMKLKANDLFANKQFSASIMVYNAAINLQPDRAVLYGNRAAAYIKRNWDGDIYAALRDCYKALLLNPNHVKANFRLARCLYELRWLTEAQKCLKDLKNNFPDFRNSRALAVLEKDVKIAIKKDKSSETNKRHVMMGDESYLRGLAFDYTKRYCGHCNTTTDIKEANFFGNNGQYIVAGSDDGSFFVWERATTNLVRVMRADDSIVNCLQPHPNTCMLATSGIDPIVRLWSPLSAGTEDRTVKETESAAEANQRRMNEDPLEAMLLSMGMRTSGEREEAGESVSCRTN
ncbi:WD and tetratricopeptide repeats protein 1-like [Ciona intestinalis]